MVVYEMLQSATKQEVTDEGRKMSDTWYLEARENNEAINAPSEYRARVLGLGRVEFTTADDLPLHKPQKLAFSHPWIRHILGPSDEAPWEGVSGFEAGPDDVALPSPLHDVSAPQVHEYTRALQMIARLGQPFSALLLVQQQNGEYKRVAAENRIVVSRLGTDINSKDFQATVLEIL
ncbi:hypothetical protein EV401DRAFT_2075569 [Pisolithus croceorrhizus]|nr:hypothetical protein EV401DRAFT_2075569 [Pisolithus croceorrhizus]